MQGVKIIMRISVIMLAPFDVKRTNRQGSTCGACLLWVSHAIAYWTNESRDL